MQIVITNMNTDELIPDKFLLLINSLLDSYCLENSCLKDNHLGQSNCLLDNNKYKLHKRYLENCVFNPFHLKHLNFYH